MNDKAEIKSPKTNLMTVEKPEATGKGEVRLPASVADMSDLKSFAYCEDIGKGGQGECSLVKRHKDGKPFVLKTIQKLALSKGNIPMEIRVTNNVLPRNKRIVRLYRAVAFPDYAHLFLEYCDGGDLTSLIDKYSSSSLQIPEAFIWHVVVHLSEALAFLHRGWRPKNFSAEAHWETVLHRDIKPNNIFLSHRKDGGYPDVILGDFGLAGVTTDQGHEQRFNGGTAVWQPPERPHATEKGDVWALGAIIHTMAGNGPPIGRIPKEWGSNIEGWWKSPDARQVRSITPFYSRRLEDWMLTCLRPKSIDRIESIELATQLQSEGRRFRSALYTPLAPFVSSTEKFVFREREG